MTATQTWPTVQVSIDDHGNPSVDPIILHAKQDVEWTTANGADFDLKWDSLPPWDKDLVHGKSWGRRKKVHNMKRTDKAAPTRPKAKYVITLYDANGNVSKVVDPDMVMDT